MGLLSLEHGTTADRADVAVQVAAIAALAVLLLRSPPGMALELLACTGAGAIGWTLIEYGLHRFVLHGVQPFKRWHAAHHQRPAALIGLPVPASAALFVALVFAPAWWLGGPRPAGAWTLGVLVGYLAYTITHHVMHHRTPDLGPRFGAWLQRRRRWHAAHHGRVDSTVCFGVTSAFWDRVFGSPRTGGGITGGDAHGRP